MSFGGDVSVPYVNSFWAKQSIRIAYIAHIHFAEILLRVLAKLLASKGRTQFFVNIKRFWFATFI